jgi:hypothetical protein
LKKIPQLREGMTFNRNPAGKEWFESELARDELF